MLDDILQTLPANSSEAMKLQLVIRVLTDVFSLGPLDVTKLKEDLGVERLAREHAQQELQRCTEELNRLKSR